MRTMVAVPFPDAKVATLARALGWRAEIRGHFVGICVRMTP
ncbi:MAG TPA: hypothetical protein VFA00_00085 [Actinomycetota bacterium]|nr:hypothetical protein [Actinomycetota bacterium]